ncbi:hypothetical protein NLJ89_g5123 [Agrocybe chaxingu]|uniref:Uncharacterized protein n=1 Tax=Agrocybe chaxingu TaxID=84603 RepID=A0A9W8K7T8_9AGAR|nr:hypothetical protein NLJ89_g5123 [Agrocybe chaxingu]
MLFHLIVTLFYLAAGLHGVFAQSDASCLPFYNWTFNSHNESPCEVASSLLAVCNGGPYPVDALPDASHYIGPSLDNANPCQCNTVVYSLMSACAACQGRTYLFWSVWSANCVTVYINEFPAPLPSGVFVPGWAYLDIKTLDNFDQSNARANANRTESSSIPPPTPSSTRTSASRTPTLKPSKQASPVAVKSTSSSSVATPSPTVSEAATAEDDSDPRANAIGGSIVGGLLGLAVIGGMLFWLIKRRQWRSRNGVPLASPTDTEQGQSVCGEGRYMREAADNSGRPISIPPSPSFNSSMVATPAMFTANTSLSGSRETVGAIAQAPK